MFETLSYWTLFAVSFISATIYPLASEAFVAAFVAEGFSPLSVFVTASVANTLGAVTTYLLARFGAKFAQKSLEKLRRFRFDFNRFGWIFAFFSFLPIFGDLFVVSLGLSRYPFFKTLLFIAAGKAFRYAVLIWLSLKIFA